MAERRVRLATAALLSVAVPAAVAAAPESILPPGFGSPAAPRPPAPRPPAPPSPPRATPVPRLATPVPRPTVPAPEPATPTPPPPPSVTPGFGPPSPTVTVSPRPPEVAPAMTADVGAATDRTIVYRRPADIVGAVGSEDGGIAPDGFGNADGRFLVALLDATRAPLTSRWQQIVARRTLMSAVPTPANTTPGDWVGARADFLARSGEADGARRLVSAIDPDRMTQGFSRAAMLVGLANADPSGLCPYTSFVTGRTPTWRMAQAICAGLSGEPGRAVALIEQALRANGGRRTPDILLAEKVIGASANGRRAVRMRWDNIAQLTPWRYGMAAATGAEVPAALWESAPDEIRAWGARAPLLDDMARLPLARTAATLGAFSASDLVTAYSAALATGDTLTKGVQAEVDALRTAYVGEDADARSAALRTLWGPVDTLDYGALVLTAYAAGRVTPDEALAADADRIVASLFTAGLDTTAARWADVADGGGEATDGAWALLAVGSPRTVVDGSSGRVESFVGRQDDHRGAMLVAALAGLGRLDTDEARALIAPTGLALDGASRWSRTLAAAVRQNQPGTVVLLASAGMQVRDWADLPPQHLYHILTAYRAVGMDGAARMIAAEALTRA